MTIQATSRRAGPFLGNGVATVFSFAFRIWAAPTLVVQTADNDAVSTGLVTLTQGVHYSVTLNPDQATNPGGSITLVAPLAAGKVLAITSRLAIEQTTDITNQGSFFPDVLEGAIDRNTALIQQLAEQLERAVIVASTSTTTPAEVATELFDASAQVAAAVSTAQAAATSAGNSAAGANASAVAADAARVEAVAAYNAAADYATQASGYANTASSRATAAAASATAASTASNEAGMYASNASGSENAAAAAAATAIGQVAAAANSATASANSATAASTSATTAQNHANAAAQSAADAAAAAGSAGGGGGGGDDNLFFNPSGAVHQRVVDGVLTTNGTAWPCDGVQLISADQATVNFKASVVASTGPVARTAIRVEATGQNWNTSKTYLRIPIEGADAARMRWGVANSQPVTFSFYVRSVYNSWLTFGMRSWAAGGTYSTFMTRGSVTTDWTRVSLTVQPQPGANASDWPATAGSTGFALLIWLRPYAGTMNMEQWTSGNASSLATIAGQGDYLGDVGSWIEFQGIKVQIGGLTPFSEPKFTDALEKAKRYFQKSYTYPTAPGAPLSGYSPDVVTAMSAGTGPQPHFHLRFAPALAGNATLTLYNPKTGAMGVTAFRNQAKGDNSTAYSGLGGPGSWAVQPAMTNLTAIGDLIAVSWTAAYDL